MSSKILKLDSNVQPVEWRPPVVSPDGVVVEDLSAGPQPFVPGGASGGPSAGGGRQQADLERIHALEERIRGLEREVEQARAAGRADGLREGEANGARQEAARWAEPQQRLAGSIESMARLKDRFRAEVEEDAIKLALAVARKILNRELSVDPEALHGLVRVAMSKVSLRELQRVRVHPDDAASIQKLLAGFESGGKRVTVEADRTLERGAAIFETERGALDASVTTQLGEIERGLTDALSSSIGGSRG